MKNIYYNTVGRENGKFVIKGQFNTQKEALDLANELNKKFPDLYYDWNETLIKEEPKQEFLLFDKERADTITSEGQKTVRELQNTIQQETLEEAAENESEYLADWEDKSMYVRGFVDSAKYQAERMYSEEEVERLCMSAYNQATKDGSEAWLGTFDKWFEQFKKK